MPEEIKTLTTGDVCIIKVGAVPVSRVLIKDIVPDKKDWWFVTFLQLEQFIHPMEWSWLLDYDHLNQEVFEMNGVPHCLIKIGSVISNGSQVPDKELEELRKDNQAVKNNHEELF